MSLRKSADSSSGEWQLALAERVASEIREAFYVVDRDGTIVYASEEFGLLLKRPVEEIVGLSLYSISPRSPLAELRDGERLRFRSAHSGPGGQTIHLEVSGSGIKVEGEAYRLAYCKVVSAQAAVEVSGAQDDLLYLRVVDDWPDEIARYDQNCRRVYVNHAMGGVGPRESLLGRTPTESFPDSKEMALYEDKIREVLATGIPATFDLGWDAPSDEPKFRSLRLVPERGPDGGVSGVFAIASDLSEKKRAEEQVSVSEERLNEAQRVARVGSWVWMPSGDLIWSDMMYELFGVEQNQPATFDVFLATVHPEDREETAGGFYEWIHSGKPHKEVEYRLLFPDGSVRVIVARGQVERNDEGEVTRAFGTCQDITDRKAAETELARLNRSLRMLSDSNQALIHIADEETLLREICRIAVEVGGYRMAWIGFAKDDDGKSVQPAAQTGFELGYLESAKLTWADRGSGRGPVGAAIRSGKPCVARNSPTDPNYDLWRKSPFQGNHAATIALPLASDGVVFGAVSIHSDAVDAFDHREVDILKELAADVSFGLTVLRTRAERDKANEALKESETIYRSVVTAMAEGLVFQSATGEITAINPAAEKIEGRSPDQMLGKTSDDPQWGAIREDGSDFPGEEHPSMVTLKTGEPQSNVVMGISQPDGARRWISVNSEPLTAEEGASPYAVVTTFHDITERKQATEALRNVLRHARTMVMRSMVTAPEGFDLREPEWSSGRYTWVSHFDDEITAQEVLPLELLPGQSYADAWHSRAKFRSDEESMHLVAARAFVSGASNWHQEFRAFDRDGNVHWFTQAASVEAAGHGCWRVTTINTDFTERKLAEERLRTSMVRLQQQEAALVALTRKEVFEGGDLMASLRRLTEATAKALGVERVSLWRFASGGKVIRCIDLYELSPDRHSDGQELAAVDYPIYFGELAECEVIAADDAQRGFQTSEFSEGYLKPLGISSMLDIPIQLKGALDGVLCHEHVGPMRQWTTDERTFAIAIANLVTLLIEEWERERAQAELRQSQQAYASLVNTMDGIVWEMDVESFRFTFVSPQAERLLGYPIGRWLEDSSFWPEHLHPEDREWCIDFCLKATAEKRDHDFEYRMIAADGREVWLHDLVTVVVEEDRPVKLTGIMVDITARKLAEAERENLEGQLRQAQKIEALGTLAGGIAHDFNNILGTILGNVELASQDVGQASQLLASLEQIREAGHRARDLTQQILLFGRRQQTSLEPIQVYPVIEHCVNLLRASLPARITVAYSNVGEVPDILADPTQILQVLINLGANAEHAIGERPGRIEISASSVNLDEAQANIDPNLKPGRYVRISVCDTGKGIDPGIQERIFEPFFTTKQIGEGTGLGLSVVHGIMRSHNGAITLQSQIGHGSTFDLYLPAAPASVNLDRGQESARTIPQGNGQHILCIDDDESLLYLVKRLLERHGYYVSGFEEPSEALKVLRENPNLFSAAVTDYNMPGMSGLEVVQAIREIDRNLPVAIASGFITDDLRIQAKLAGAQELIFKPNAAEEYCAAVARLLQGPSEGS